MNSPVTTVIESTILLVALVSVWRFGIREALIDVLRQDLFEIRDRLFDVALDPKNRLAFSDEAYIAFREAINSHIRHTNRLTPWAMLTFKILRIVGLIQRDDPQPNNLQNLIHSFPVSQTQTKLKSLYFALQKAWFKHHMRTAFPIVFPTMLVFFARALWKSKGLKQVLSLGFLRNEWRAFMNKEGHTQIKEIDSEEAFFSNRRLVPG